MAPTFFLILRILNCNTKTTRSMNRTNKLPSLVEDKDKKTPQPWQEGRLQDGRHVSELTGPELDELIEKVKDWRFSQNLLHKQTTILRFALEELGKRDEAYYLELERPFQEYLLGILREVAPFLSVKTGRLALQELQDALLEKSSSEVAKLEKLSDHD